MILEEQSTNKLTINQGNTLKVKWNLFWNDLRKMDQMKKPSK